MAKGMSKPETRERHERWLRAYLEGGTFKQIAAAEGVTFQAVEQAVHRGLQRRGLRLEHRRMLVRVVVPVPAPREPRVRRRDTEVRVKGRAGHPQMSLEEIQARWDRWRSRYMAGASIKEIALEEGVTEPAIRYAIRRQFVIGDNPRRRRTEQVLPMGVLQLQELVASRLRREEIAG